MLLPGAQRYHEVVLVAVPVVMVMTCRIHIKHITYFHAGKPVDGSRAKDQFIYVNGNRSEYCRLHNNENAE
jgi:hypothetical protein